MKYAAIADWATDQQYSVTFMCAQLGVVRQGYYRWLADGPCQRERTDAELTSQIKGKDMMINRYADLLHVEHSPEPLDG